MFGGYAALDDVGWPMTKTEIVPPRNLLEQVEGVERTLRRGRRLGALGWLSAIFGLAQVIVAVASAEIWKFDIAQLGDQWPLWSAITFFVLAGRAASRAAC